MALWWVCGGGRPLQGIKVQHALLRPTEDFEERKEHLTSTIPLYVPAMCTGERRLAVSLMIAVVLITGESLALFLCISGFSYSPQELHLLHQTTHSTSPAMMHLDVQYQMWQHINSVV